MKHFKHGLPELREARNQSRGLLSGVFVFSIFVNLLMLTGPLFMLQVYDRVLGSRSEETLVALSLLVGALYALMALLEYARGRVMARFGARFQTALDGRVFSAVMLHALKPQNRANPNTALQDLSAIQMLFTSPVMLALFDIPWTPIFTAAIFIFHPVLGWLALGGGAVLILITFANNWLTRRKIQEAHGASAQAQGFADQVRQGAEIVRAQGMGYNVATRWHGMRDEALEQNIHASDWSGFFTAFTKAFRLFLQSAMLAVGAWLVLQGSMTAGAMIAGSILMGRALAPIEQTLNQWTLIQRARAGWGSLKTLLEKTPPGAKTIALPRPEAHLSLNAVTAFAPGAVAPTIIGATLEVKPGEAVGIIGNSGSGKSTLAKTMLGLLRPISGEIRLGGATLDQYDPDALGSFVGYLPQNVILFSGTIAENIARMSPDPDDTKVVEAAKRANAHEMILSLPNGYQTVIQGQDSQLSGGQQQRVALARALYDDPVLLVLDEPNSALDNEGSAALNRTVRDFRETGRSVVIMTHRPAAIAECQRLVVIENGRIRADGPRDEVMRATLQNADRLQRSIPTSRGVS